MQMAISLWKYLFEWSLWPRRRWHTSWQRWLLASSAPQAHPADLAPWHGSSLPCNASQFLKSFLVQQLTCLQQNPRALVQMLLFQ